MTEGGLPAPARPVPARKTCRAGERIHPGGHDRSGGGQVFRAGRSLLQTKQPKYSVLIKAIAYTRILSHYSFSPPIHFLIHFESSFLTALSISRNDIPMSYWLELNFSTRTTVPATNNGFSAIPVGIRSRTLVFISIG